MKKRIFKIFIIYFVLIAITTPALSQGLNFSSIRIGDQQWMSINWNSYMPKSWWYNNDSISNKKHGRLYFFSNAVAAAPDGWHLPSLEEWQQLIDNMGGDSIAGKKLLDQPSGLNLTWSGHKSANITTEDIFDLKESYGYYWTSTIKGDQTAYAIEFRKGVSYVTKNYFRKANGFSVRYIKDKD